MFSISGMSYIATSKLNLVLQENKKLFNDIWYNIMILKQN